MYLPLLLGLSGGLGGCAEVGAEGIDPGSVDGVREAAEAADAAWGVPADLTLAVAFNETRLQLPVDLESGHEHESGGAHVPTPVGIGGLPHWLDYDPVGIAERRLDVTADVIAIDPAIGILATAAVLRELAERRFGDALPAADDPAAWTLVLGDFAGLTGEAARGYAASVLAWVRIGLDVVAAGGERVLIHSRELEAPELVAGAQAYGGAEYPGARWVPAHSSNQSGRLGESIRYVVIHTVQGSYAGAISWFQNSSSNVSAHFVVRSSDGEVTQMLRESANGWHAGNSTYNRQSIGIEHEGYVSDPARWYTDAMYRSSAALTRYICDKYGIPRDRSRIIGHVEVPRATHTDPGTGWDWSRYMALVNGGGTTPPPPATPDYAAEYVDRNVPATMESGERAVAWVEMRNTGAATWDIGITRLGTTGPRDHASPFHDAENWIGPNRATPPDHSNYATGMVGRFTFMITAPEVTEETTVTDTFGLVQEGVTWFGPEDVTLSVTVRPRPGTEPDPGAEPDPGMEPDPTMEPDPAPGVGSDPVPVVEEPSDPLSPSGRPGGASLHGACSVGPGIGSTGIPLWVMLLAVAGAIRRRRTG